MTIATEDFEPCLFPTSAVSSSPRIPHTPKHGNQYDTDSAYDGSPVSILFNKTSPRSGDFSSEEFIATNDAITEDHTDKSELLPDQHQGGSSTFGSIFLIVNAALGAGLLNMPKAFDQAGGVMTAILVQAVLLVFIMTALLILAMTSNIKKSCTLQEVMIAFM